MRGSRGLSFFGSPKLVQASHSWISPLCCDLLPLAAPLSLEISGAFPKPPGCFRELSPFGACAWLFARSTIKIRPTTSFLALKSYYAHILSLSLAGISFEKSFRIQVLGIICHTFFKLCIKEQSLNVVFNSTLQGSVAPFVSFAFVWRRAVG